MRLVEDEKEHGHAEGTKRIDERWEQGDRGYKPLSNAQDDASQMEGQDRRCEDGADQRQQCRTLEVHARIMNDARARRKLGRWRLTVLPEFGAGPLSAAHRVENLVEVSGRFRRNTLVRGEAERDCEVTPSSTVCGSATPIGSTVELTIPP